MLRTAVGALCLAVVFSIFGCRSAAEPSALLGLTFTSPVIARLVDGVAVLEFPVELTDLDGVAGTVHTVETRVYNASLGIEIGRNLRPNASVGIPNVDLPANGRLVLEAGVGFAPPALGHVVQVLVIVSLADGRAAQHLGVVVTSAT